MKDFRHSQTDVLGTMTSRVRQVKNWNSFQQSRQARRVGSFAQIPSSTTTLVDQGVGEAQRVYGVDSNRSLNSDNRSAMVENTTAWNSATSKKKKIVDKKYRRYEKPPYSYVGLIALAIRSSTNQMLKLSEVLTRISSMFPFFKGEYQGWRDSVRHNLSQNKCFKKVLQDPSRPHSKGNYWTVDVSLIPAEKLKRQNTSVSRNVAPGYTYARDLTEIFDLETGKLKVSKSVGSHYGFHEDYIERQNDPTPVPLVPPTNSCLPSKTAMASNLKPPNQLTVQSPQENVSNPIQWKDNHSEFTQIVSPNERGNNNLHPATWKTCYTPDSTFMAQEITPNTSCNNSTNAKPQYIEPLICSDLVSSSTDVTNYRYQPSPNDFSEVAAVDSPIAEQRASVDSPVPTDSSDGEYYPSTAKTMVSEQPKLSAINMEKIIKRKRYSRKHRTANKKARVSRPRSSLENRSENENYSKSGSPESIKSQISINSSNTTTSPKSNSSDINDQTTATKSPTTAQQPPPNQNPFDDTQQKQNKSSDIKKKPKLWSNIDNTVGPEGPPNITWTSSNALQAVKPYFEPNNHSVLTTQTSPNQWNNALDLNDNHLDIPVVESINSDNQFSYKQGGLVSDQSEFLKEQAGIVTGRSSNSATMFSPRLLPPYIPPLPNMHTHLPAYGHVLPPTTTNSFYPQSNYPVSQSTYSNSISNQMYSNAFSQASTTYQPSTTPYLAPTLPTEETLLNTSKLGSQYPQVNGFYQNQSPWPTHQMPYVDSGYANTFLPPL